MKWDDDPHKYEKNFLLDAIIKFSYVFKNKEACEISLKDVCGFIDAFLDEDKDGMDQR